VAFLLYVFYLMSPIQEVVGAITQYQTGSAALARIQEALRLPAEPAALPAPLPAAGAEPASLAFADVRFRYAEDLPYVHHGVTFAVPARGMTAFVGPSGAGKTTVFSLIERFYDPESGTISLDGRDVADWELPQLRSAIGYVEQDAPVLSGSLRANLLLGNPDADDESIERVLKTTRLDGLVARLPQGVETLVGHRGTKLSGGERQRVAIARALLRRPRLLLDEATSQLDAVNEAALRDTVADVARTTTVLVVAHRLSTVTTADRIVVMDAGRSARWAVTGNSWQPTRCTRSWRRRSSWRRTGDVPGDGRVRAQPWRVKAQPWRVKSQPWRRRNRSASQVRGQVAHASSGRIV
jgi:ABC-type multidrug transport system fused ATPase/permease subunit